jgi:predicted lipid carrier protein YhbT
MLDLPRPSRVIEFACIGAESALRRLPPPPVSMVAAVLNHLLRGQPARSRLAELDGKVVALVFEDAGFTVALRFRGERIEAAPAQAADVSLRGKLEVFRALVLRTEDPDTLFFHRRLSIEGETETGLRLKNLLDALEFDTAAHLEDVLPRPVASVAVAALERVRAAAADARPTSSG